MVRRNYSLVQILQAVETSGRVIDQGGAPSSFELFNGTFEKKYNIIISLQNAIYYKLDIEKVDGKWEYKFHFYY